MGFLPSLTTKHPAAGAGATSQKANVGDKQPPNPTGQVVSSAVPSTQWQNGLEPTGAPGSAPAAGGVPDLLRSSVSSLSDKWSALISRPDGLDQKGWEALLADRLNTAKNAPVDAPDVKNAVRWINESVDRLSTLAKTDPTNPDVGSLYQGLADAVGTMTKAYDIPPQIKTKLLESVLPALDRSTLTPLAPSKHNKTALASRPPELIYNGIAAPLFDNLQKTADPATRAKLFMGLATAAAEIPDKSRQHVAQEILPNAVVSLYPDVPRHSTEPVIPFPQLDPGGAAKAWFFRGTYPDALDKAKFGTGAQINFKTELDHLAKGGATAQEALDHLQAFLAAQPPVTPPAK
jgi:hypothetical protein